MKAAQIVMTDPAPPATRDQLARAILFVVVAAPPVLAAATLLQPWIDPALLWVDPIQQANRLAQAERSGVIGSVRCCPYYVGAASQFGVLAWMLAAGFSGVAALIAAGAALWRAAWFFLSAAAISAMLGMDDAILLHEQLQYHVPGGKALIIAGYAMIVGGHLVIFRDMALSRRAPLLIAALGLFAASILLDRIVPADGAAAFEDALKFVGASWWAGFHLLTAHDLLGWRVAPGARLRTPADLRAGGGG